MKKQEYHITILEKGGKKTDKTVKGYIYKCGKYFFGVTGERYEWRITELATGMYTGVSVKKLDDVGDGIIDFLQRIGAKQLDYIIEQGRHFIIDYDYSKSNYTEILTTNAVWNSIYR